MSLIPKVRRIAYRQQTQSGLAVFADNVYNLMNTLPAYESLAAIVTVLGAKTVAYRNAIKTAENKGRSEMVLLQMAKKELLAALNDISNGLDYNANGNPAYIVNAGMQLYKVREMHTAPVPVPYEVSAMSNGQPGYAEVIFKMSERKQVIANAVEWSTDRQVWHNGTYKNASRILVSNLPNKTEVFFRIRSIGTRERVSEWTDGTTSAFVL